MIRKIWNCNTFWLLLTDLAVEKEALYADTKIVVCYNSSVLCFPIDGPERIDWNRKVSISTGENLISNLWESDFKRWSDFIVDHISNSTYEKDFESRSEVWPDVSPNFDIDIKSVNVNNYVNRIDCWYNTAIWKGLSGKWHTKSNGNCVDVNFDVTLRRKWPWLVAESLIVKNTAQLVASQNKGIIGNISVDKDVWCALV